jgi:ADP-heptose:LPS heptosyltransferase
MCIQSTSATYFTVNKQWPVDRIQAIVDRLHKSMRIVQVGSKDDVELTHAEDYRGKMSLRQTAAMLAQARLFVGMEGGLMHLARSVDTRSVIIYTGFITPYFSGYDVNVNLCKVDRPESPCWRLSKCDCDCAERVSVQDVLVAIDAALSLPSLAKHYHVQD